MTEDDKLRVRLSVHHESIQQRYPSPNTTGATFLALIEYVMLLEKRIKALESRAPLAQSGGGQAGG